jgi:hypothetical protein
MLREDWIRERGSGLRGGLGDFWPWPSMMGGGRGVMADGILSGFFLSRLREMDGKPCECTAKSGDWGKGEESQLIDVEVS